MIKEIQTAEINLPHQHKQHENKFTVNNNFGCLQHTTKFQLNITYD